MQTSVVDWKKCNGLVPVVVQLASTKEVLMMAYMNEEALAETIRSGCAVYFSRRTQSLWRKGEQSGNMQIVREILIDCDVDTLLLRIDQMGGAACHDGYRSCFYRRLTEEGLKTVTPRIFDPSHVYGKKGD